MGLALVELVVIRPGINRDTTKCKILQSLGSAFKGANSVPVVNTGDLASHSELTFNKRPQQLGDTEPYIKNRGENECLGRGLV